MDVLGNHSCNQSMDQDFNHYLDLSSSSLFENPLDAITNGSVYLNNDDLSNGLSTRSYRQLDDSLSRYIAYSLALYYCPLLIIFGTIGNTLSIMVFSRKNMKSSSMSVYIRFMACNDLAALYMGPVYEYLYTCHNIDISLLHGITCKTFRFLVYLFTDVSAYTIISLTSERLLSVLFPHKVRLFCSKRMSYYVIVVMFILLGLCNSPLILWSNLDTIVDNQTHAVTTSCTFQPDPTLNIVWRAVDLVKFTVIPLGFITISNLILLQQLYGNRRCATKLCCCCMPGNQQEMDVTEISRQVNRRKQRSITLTLICVSLVFFVCNVPAVLFPSQLVVLPTAEHQELVSTISMLLMYTNNSLNFLLYCACGTRFRNELMAMLCFRRLVPGTKTSSVASTEK